MAVEIEGLDELLSGLEKLPKQMQKTLKKQMRRAGSTVRSAARKKMRGTRAGRIYYKRAEYKPREWLTDKPKYKASRPGEGPKRVVGALSRSLTVRVSKSGKSVVVRTSWPTAHLLEYGTDTMEARPYLSTAMEQESQRIYDLIEAGVAEALKGWSPL